MAQGPAWNREATPGWQAGRPVEAWRGVVTRMAGVTRTGVGAPQIWGGHQWEPGGGTLPGAAGLVRPPPVKPGQPGS